MKNQIIFLVIVFFLFVFFSCSGDGGDVTADFTDNIIDHRDISVGQLDDAAVAGAAALTVYMEHASVGGNIWAGLESLESGNSRYDNSNITFYNRGNPGAKDKFDDFNTRVTDNLAAGYQNPVDYDIMMTKLCYIDDAHGGFASVTLMFEYYRDMMNALEAAYTGTVFVWMTIPIKTVGNSDSDTYNALLRNYCNANNKILFDIADIECHTPGGQKLTDSTGEVMDSSYTDDGGHLNDEGQSRAARACWGLLYRISRL